MFAIAGVDGTMFVLCIPCTGVVPRFGRGGVDPEEGWVESGSCVGSDGGGCARRVWAAAARSCEVVGTGLVDPKGDAKGKGVTPTCTGVTGVVGVEGPAGGEFDAALRDILRCCSWMSCFCCCSRIAVGAFTADAGTGVIAGGDASADDIRAWSGASGGIVKASGRGSIGKGAGSGWGPAGGADNG